MPRSLGRQWKGRRLLKGEAPWNRDYIDGRNGDELCHPAIDLRAQNPVGQTQIIAARQTELATPTRESGRNEDAISGRTSLHIVADTLHDARDIASTNVRQRHGKCRNTLPDPDIEMIEGAGLDAHANLAGVDGRLDRFLVPEHFGPAVLIKDRRLHGLSYPAQLFPPARYFTHPHVVIDPLPFRSICGPDLTSSPLI